MHQTTAETVFYIAGSVVLLIIVIVNLVYWRIRYRWNHVGKCPVCGKKMTAIHYPDAGPLFQIIGRCDSPECPSNAEQ